MKKTTLPKYSSHKKRHTPRNFKPTDSCHQKDTKTSVPFIIAKSSFPINFKFG